MAKKSDFSHIGAQEALELATSILNAENLPFVLLSTFCGYGDASIERVKDGRDNKSREANTILVKDKLVYRPYSPGKEPMDTIIALRDSAAITRHNPRLYITCDGANIVAYDPKDDDLYEGALDTLWRDFEFFKPLAGIEKFRNYEEAEADVKTAELMAKIYDDICRYNDFRDKEVSHHINVFMSRLLFCFFAEDTGLFKQNQFTQAIENNTNADGSDLADFIDRLFVIMSTDDKGLREQQTNKVISDFPYVNGGLFLQRYPIPKLSRRTRALMIKCGKYQWRDINPDIFGSMTQAIVSPEQRSELGIHYTSVPNIMKVIQPLFLDELAAEFLRCRNNAKDLNALLVRMSKIKFFDPACGSGNFLIITYKRIRELEIEIWKRLEELGDHRLPFSEITLTQFYGIELDEYACDTATLSLWLAEHQMNNKFRDEFGTCPNPLPLRPSGHIVCGNACTIEWNSICPNDSENEEIYVMGNPPYLGSRKQTDSMKHDMDVVFGRYNENYRELDYISCWFLKASEYIRGKKQKSAFVSTNSITQGEQVSLLWPLIFRHNAFIEFAYTSFKWSNNAKNNAGVTCIIIGISKSDQGKRKLYSSGMVLSCDNINPYLVIGDNVIVEPENQSISGLPLMQKGCAPGDGGCLLLSEDEKDFLLDKYPELAEVVKLFLGADEIINGYTRYCFWLDNDSYNRLKYIPELYNRVEMCRQIRAKSKKAATRKKAQTPFMFDEIRYKVCPTIIVPQTTSENRLYIPIEYRSADIVYSNGARVIYDASLYLFGILTSLIHNMWVQRVSGRLETRIQYSNTICYNTFPAPKLNTKQISEIESLAKEVLLIRAEHSDMTLGEMYEPDSMPDDLRAAHHALDLAVERCYREKPFESDEERLEFLFKQYVKLTTDKSTLWKI
jgi:hypothetical protein